ncbi:MAG: cyclic nucleotide-binding domain-containing protein [Planctomycetes bacterium]|nr:cyclic nucleotide-binding domain-containing protein [Planctomycetota bacterium]
MTRELSANDVFPQIPLFDSLTGKELRQLAGITTAAEFKPGDYVLRQGQTSQDLWVVLTGSCEVIDERSHSGETNGEPIVLAELGPFDSFGEMSFFQPAPHSASVRARTPLRVLRIERASYDVLIKDGCPGAYKLACNVVACLADRLRRMDEWTARLLAEDALERRVPEWNDFRQKLFRGWNL